jgi:hypothetical protein
MRRHHWLVAPLAVVALLIWAAPAHAQCVGSGCYRYYADITVEVSTSPSGPLLPNTVHSYTVSVTNTGWVGYLTYPPVPAPSVASGHVYILIQPTSTDEHPVRPPAGAGPYSGVPFPCTGGYGGLVCDALSLPTNSTSVFTVYFQVPSLPGAYGCHITADSYMWDEYNEYNNDVTVNYTVDVPRLPRPAIPA